MLQVFLCDDMAEVRASYAQVLEQLAHKHQLPVSLKLFANGEQLLFALEEAPNEADIIYLDIYMGQLTGIAVGRRLREMGCHAEIIYLTTSEGDVFDALDVSPLHYILKERTAPEKFEEIFLRAAALARRKDGEYFSCENARRQYQIPVWSIRYFEISNRIVTLYYGEGESLSFYSTIERLQTQLDSRRFVRCHRSFVVHLRAVARVSGAEVILTDGSSLPVGATYVKELRQAISSFLAMQP